MNDDAYISGKQEALLGKFLVAKKIIAQQQLNDTLNRKKSGDLRALGIILNRCHKINIDRIDGAVCELIEILAGSIIKKYLIDTIPKDDAFQKDSSRCDLLLQILETATVNISEALILEKRSLLKKGRGEFTPKVDDRGLNNIEGQMSVEIAFNPEMKNVQLNQNKTKIEFSSDFLYLVSESELRILKKDLLSDLKIDLLDIFTSLKI